MDVEIGGSVGSHGNIFDNNAVDGERFGDNFRGNLEICSSLLMLKRDKADFARGLDE